MLNTTTWLEKLGEHEPGFEIMQSIEQIKLENQHGTKMCRNFTHRNGLQAGLYTCTAISIALDELITQSAKRLNVGIVVVHEEFPQSWMADEGLVELNYI